jgi:hypothetical protein
LAGNAEVLGYIGTNEKAVSMRRKRRPKLTLKTAKTIAIKEVGTAKGLIPHENNSTDYQRYEMQMGKYTLVISSPCKYWGIACASFGGNRTYYKIGADTPEEDAAVTDREQKRDMDETIRDAAICRSHYVFKALLEEHGIDTCRRILERSAISID